MSRRLHPTLADYLVIAVSPALIMTLVGSLVFFLLDIFYQGQYVARLHFVFACFVMAAVLIGRISIEMGSSHAMMYAAPLALVTLAALNKFVQYPGGVAADYSLGVNVGLVVLIMWCAYKLTWDCTFIDESREESGEGVLRTMGLDRKKKRGQNSFSPAGPSVAKDAGAKKSSDPFSSQAGEGSRPTASKESRPHSGGIWVVYFSLAALPLFGLGQRLVPPENLDRRRYAFLLLCVYVASALGLLLTTSLLGLRRYLRGRRLQMPVTMAGAWVMIGCLLIAAILGFAVLLPRPSPEYAISEIPWEVSSAKRAASRQAVGREGTEDSRKDAPGGEDHSRADAKKTPEQPPDASKTAQGQKDAQTDKSRSQGNRAAGDKPQSKPSEAKAPKGDGSQRESSGQETSQSGRTRDGKSADSTRDGKGSKGGSPGKRKGTHDQAKGRSSAEEKASQEQRAESTRGAKSQDAEKTGQPAPRPSPPMPSFSLSFAGILKWLFYLAVIAGVAYWAWRSWPALVEALKDFLEAWRAFWARLFGGKPGAKEAAPGESAGEVKPAPRPFADYADPFAAGWAERWSPDELVRYSFAALEAWAREHGCPRGPEQTPYEFAEGLADRAKHLGRHCRKMADLYSRAAYAPGTLPATSVAPLRDFWQHLASA